MRYVESLLEIVLRDEVLQCILKNGVDSALLHFCLLLGIIVADIAGVEGLH